MSAPPARPGESGAALVVTLVFAAALAAAAVAFIEGRRSDALSLRAQVQAVEAEAVLDAALRQAAALIANRSERQIIPGRLAWRMGSAEVAVTIESEAGKVDLNGAEEGLLQSLPLSLGVGDDRAAAFAQTVLDWRDDNSERRNLGAEDRDYDRGEHGSSGAADRPIAHPAELRYLAAVDEALWARLAPLVTVYSGASSPDRTEAPEPVRRAMAIAQGLASDEDAAEDEDQAGAGGATEPGGLRGFSGGDAGAGRLGLGGGGTGGAGRGEATSAAEETGGTATDEEAGARTVILDVRFPNGYEAAAKAVIAFAGDGGGGGGTEGAPPPFTVLDWAPILREQGVSP